MKYEMKRVVLGGSDEMGKWRARLVIPSFVDESLSSLNAFYDNLSEVLVKMSLRCGLCTVLEMRAAFAGKDKISLVGDIFCYKNKSLSLLMRISDNRTANGYIITPPSKIRRRIKNGGWYFDSERCYVYENTYIKGSEGSLRRGLYSTLISEQSIELKL